DASSLATCFFFPEVPFCFFDTKIYSNRCGHCFDVKLTRKYLYGRSPASRSGLKNPHAHVEPRVQSPLRLLVRLGQRLMHEDANVAMHARKGVIRFWVSSKVRFP